VKKSAMIINTANIFMYKIINLLIDVLFEDKNIIKSCYPTLGAVHLK